MVKVAHKVTQRLLRAKEGIGKASSIKIRILQAEHRKKVLNKIDLPYSAPAKAIQETAEDASFTHHARCAAARVRPRRNILIGMAAALSPWRDMLRNLRRDSASVQQSTHGISRSVSTERPAGGPKGKAKP